MAEEHPHTLEDKLAERLTRLGLQATVLSLIVLLAVIFGNVLVLALKVAVSFVLAALVNQGPAVAALLSGISTAIGYYGRTRLLRRKEKFDMGDEARDQTLDQAGNALQKAPDALRSRLGCSSSLSLGVFAVSLVFCLLTYPLHVFGAQIAVATATATPTSTATATAVPVDTATTVPTMIATTQPTATTPASTAIVSHPPTATPTRVPTATPTATPIPPPPGKLAVLTTTPIDLGYACGYTFSGEVFSFTNNGGSTLYWTVTMPQGITLEQNYPTSGSLLPNEADSQNEYFQGTKERNVAITIAWGGSPTNEPNTTSLPLTCTPPVP